MNCRTVQQRLSDRIGRLLPLAEQKRLADHLSRCENCRELDDRLREASSKLGALALPLAPEGFVMRVMERLPEKRPAPWRLWLRSEFGFGLSYVGRRALLAGSLALVLLTSTAGVVSKNHAEKRGREYLQACVERHALYASTGPQSETSVLVENIASDASLRFW